MLHAPLEERVWRYEIDVPDAHGGNLDTPEIRPGTTVYLGVNVPGALFSLGDGHARQGQGEGAAVAKAFLPGPKAAYDGMHARLEGISGVS
jgi:acetamidase/formamidase